MRGKIVATALLVASCLPLGAVAARASAPDPGFGANGTVTDMAGLVVVPDDAGRMLVLDMSQRPSLRIRRYDAAGALDPTYGTAGTLMVPNTELTTSVPPVLVPGGGLELAATTNPGTVPEVLRLTDTGALDPSFATGGTLTLADSGKLRAVRIEDDGALVWVSESSDLVVVHRSIPTGAPDATFAGDGSLEVTTSSPVPPILLAEHADRSLTLVSDRGYRLAISPTGADYDNGDTLVDFTSVRAAYPDHDGGTLVVGTRDATPTVTTVYRIDAHRDLDTTYGTGGFVELPGTYEGAVPWGTRLVVRTWEGTNLQTGTLRVSALDGHGLDSSFATGGIYTTGPGLGPTDTQGQFSHQSFAVPAPDHGLIVGQSYHWTAGFIAPPSSRRKVEQLRGDGQVADTFTGLSSEVSAIGASPSGAKVGVLSLHRPEVFPDSNSNWLSRFSIGALPELPAAPGVPLEQGADGRSVSVIWESASTTAGSPVLGYRIDAFVPGGTEPVASAVSSSTAGTIQVPSAGRAYRLTVTARTWAGDGPASLRSTAVVAPFESAVAFADRVAQDLEFRVSASSAERDQFADELASGASTPGSLVLAAVGRDPWRATVDPVTRLYLAYFQRTPDSSGLRHWVAARRSGTTVAKISASFARSSEFRRTYGSLSSGAFVSLVYQHVLGRAGDSGGLAYWTKRLATGKTSRGQLMASFSESSEHIRRRAAITAAVGLYLGLLGRAPNANEVAASAPATALALADQLLASDAYVRRVG